VGLPCLPASVRVESSCWAGESSLGPSTTRTGRRRSRACSSTGRAPRRRRARPERLATEVLLSHRRHGRLDRIQHEAERGRQQSRNRVLRSLWYYRVAYQFLFRRRRTALALGQRAAVHGNRQRPLRAGARLAPITTPAHSPESNGLAEDFVHTSSGTTSAGPSSAPPNPCSCSSAAGSRTTTPRRHHGALGLRRPAEYRATLHSVPPSV
jgi:hypothetical protein